VATIDTVKSEKSTDSTKDSANSMTPPLGDNKFTPGTSGGQPHLSTDSKKGGGIDPKNPKKSSLAVYLPSNI